MLRKRRCFSVEFAQILRKLKEATDTSNYRIAQLLHCAQSTVKSWTDGETTPSRSKLYALADVFGVSVDQLKGVVPIDYDALQKPPVRPSVGPAVDDEDDAADESLSAPLTSEEAVEFLTLLHEDSDFRVMCRTYGKVTRKSGRQFKDKIQKLKGENE